MRLTFDRDKLASMATMMSGGREHARQAIQVAIQASVLDVHGFAVLPGFAPYDKGDLRRSLGWDVKPQGNGSTFEGAVGTNKDYGRIHEFGGMTGRGHRTRIKPTRYLSRAVTAATPAIRKRFMAIKLLKGM